MSEGRRFGLAVGSAWLLLAVMAGWRGHAVTSWGFAILGIALVAGGTFAPERLGPVYRGWMGLAAVISTVTTPIVMGVIYFFVLTPLGLVRRLASQSPLVHGRGMTSCWIAREPAHDRAATMEHQF